eukprot:TRINITY_DN50121_c0_g1_i1.p1 TRINITY_DN50121_c0_g1~~TRINITY_DN50121_c0_g1_i1.p1  ORF type:complete len:342 (+),score=13.48 TRINITY_DN50121_c0_g1_i1:145-1026(+)
MAAAWTAYRHALMDRLLSRYGYDSIYLFRPAGHSFVDGSMNQPWSTANLNGQWPSGYGYPYQYSAARQLAPEQQKFASQTSQRSGHQSADTNADDSLSDRLKNAQLKTSVFDTYAVCAALLASFCCSLPYVRDKTIDASVWWRQLTVDIQQCIVRLCTVGAVHAMLVFMFCALYTKAALTRESYQLEAYEAFSRQTKSARRSAFWILYSTSILFCVHVALSAFLTFDDEQALACFALLAMFVLLIVYQTFYMIHNATVMFLPDDVAEAAVKGEAVLAPCVFAVDIDGAHTPTS